MFNTIVSLILNNFNETQHILNYISYGTMYVFVYCSWYSVSSMTHETQTEMSSVQEYNFYLLLKKKVIDDSMFHVNEQASQSRSSGNETCTVHFQLNH